MTIGGPLSPFAIFASLYMTAIVLEMAEMWTHPAYTAFFIGALVAIVASKVTQPKFLTYLALSSAYFLTFGFPDVANHVNFILYANIFFAVATVYGRVRGRGRLTDDEFFALIRPVLQVSLILIYVIAGFHKLNWDYFDVDYSCATGMLWKIVSLLRSHVLGIPVAVISSVVVGAIAVSLLRRRGSSRRLVSASAVLAVGVLCASLWVRTPTFLTAGAGVSVGGVVAVLVIAWELVGGPLLLITRLQRFLMPIGLSMHAVLAAVGFVDFGGLAVALLFCFVPDGFCPVLNTPITIGGRTPSMNRVAVYIAINMTGAAVSGFVTHVRPVLDRSLTAGVLFEVALLVLIWPILVTVFGPAPRPSWDGVAICRAATPKLFHVFPLLLVLFGLSSYVGLRTAGNFSMFSNLRTEGASNHFLLGANSLKLWNYQDDVIRVLAFDDRYGDVIYHYDEPLAGRELPVVEFRKWIYEWNRAKYHVPITFEYRGVTVSTGDITHDPAWRTDRRTLAMLLLDFRVVQPDGPNACRW